MGKEWVFQEEGHVCNGSEEKSCNGKKERSSYLDLGWEPVEGLESSKAEADNGDRNQIKGCLFFIFLVLSCKSCLYVFEINSLLLHLLLFSPSLKAVFLPCL